MMKSAPHLRSPHICTKLLTLVLIALLFFPFVTPAEAGSVTKTTTQDFSGGTFATTTASSNKVALERSVQTDAADEDAFGGDISDGTASNESGEVELGIGAHQLLVTYDTGSDPALGADQVYHSHITAEGILYVGTGAAGGGRSLTVIDTKNTADPADDEFVFRYSTESDPAIGASPVNHSHLEGDLLYISTDGGLSVVDTKDTLSAADDELVITYNTGSNPALAGDDVPHSHFDPETNLLYISTDGSGLSVIDTKGTATTTDDELVITYNTGSTPALANNSVSHSHLDPETNLLYISTDGGLSVIDTKGTATTTDDELVITYNTGSDPALANNTVSHSHLEGDLLYISTNNGGLSVIDTKGTATTTDDELVITYNIGSDPALASNNVQHSHLEGNLLHVSLNDWGNGGLSVIDTKGTATTTDDELVTTYDTGSDPMLVNNGVLHSHLEGDLLYISTNNGGLSVIDTTEDYVATGTYTHTAHDLSDFTPYAFSYTAETTSDHAVSLQYRTGEESELISWNDWSDPCTTPTECLIDPADLVEATHIQYRLNLETDNLATTPSVSEVTYIGEYHEEGTYDTAFSLPQGARLSHIEADTTTPENTAVTFAYSTDSTTFTTFTLGESLSHVSEMSVTVRATLTTTDTTVTPSINSITLHYSAYTPPSGGRSTQSRIAFLETQGNHEEAERLRTLLGIEPEREGDTPRPATRTEQLSMLVRVLEEYVAVLETYLKVRGGT